MSASSIISSEKETVSQRLNSDKPLLDTKKFYSRFSVAFLVHVLGYGLQLAMHGSLTLCMELAEYGEFVVCLAWALLLTKVSVLGFENVLIRFIAVYKEKGKSDLAAYLINWSSGLCLISSIIILVISGLIGEISQFYGLISNASLYWLTGGIVVANALLTLQGAKLRGMDHPVISQIGVNCLRPVFTITSILFIYHSLNRVPVASEVAGIYIVATFISLFVMSRVRFYGIDKNNLLQRHKKRHVNLWKMTAVPLLVVSISTLLLRQSDIIMLGIISRPDQVAVYNIASRIAALCMFATPVINSIVGNHYASLHGAKNIPALQCLVTRSSRISLIAISIVALAIYFGGGIVLSFLGEQYVQFQGVLNILTLGWVAVAITGTGQTGLLLDMTGQGHLGARIVVFGCVLNMLLNLALIPSYGAYGASAATAAAFMIYNLIGANAVRRKVGVYVSPFYRKHTPGREEIINPREARSIPDGYSV